MAESTNLLIGMIIMLIIVIVLFNSSVYTALHRCPEDTVRIPYVRASRLPGEDFEEAVGITTINLKLDRDVPCGIYRMDTVFGSASLFVTKNSTRLGYMHYPQSVLEANPEVRKEIDSADLFDLSELNRVSGRNNLFIRNFNRGCC